MKNIRTEPVFEEGAWTASVLVAEIGSTVIGPVIELQSGPEVTTRLGSELQLELQGEHESARSSGLRERRARTKPLRNSRLVRGPVDVHRTLLQTEQNSRSLCPGPTPLHRATCDGAGD